MCVVELSYCIRLLGGSFEATMKSLGLRSTGPPVCTQGKLRGGKKATLNDIFGSSMAIRCTCTLTRTYRRATMRPIPSNQAWRDVKEEGSGAVWRILMLFLLWNHSASTVQSVQSRNTQPRKTHACRFGGVFSHLGTKTHRLLNGRDDGRN